MTFVAQEMSTCPHLNNLFGPLQVLSNKLVHQAQLHKKEEENQNQNQKWKGKYARTSHVGITQNTDRASLNL